MDVAELCGCGDVKLVQLQNGKLAKSKTNYTFSNKDVKSIYKWISELKMPDDYASNIARCENQDKGNMHDMESREYHVSWSALVGLSRFFKDICSNTLRMNNLVKMEENIPIIVCKLERIFPPTFFDSMEHYVIHHPMEETLGCPIQYQ